MPHLPEDGWHDISGWSPSPRMDMNCISKGMQEYHGDVQADNESRSSRPGPVRSEEGRAQSYYSSPSKAGAPPEPGSRRSSAGGERPGSAKGKLRRSPAPAQGNPLAHPGDAQTCLDIQAHSKGMD